MSSSTCASSYTTKARKNVTLIQFMTFVSTMVGIRLKEFPHFFFNPVSSEFSCYVWDEGKLADMSMPLQANVVQLNFALLCMLSYF